MVRPLRRLHGLLFANALALTALPVCAAVLDFGDASTFDQQYGDVPGLLDASYTYHLGDTSAELSWWDTGYDELRGVAWGAQPAAGTIGRITLTALDPARPVLLASFQLGSWEGSGNGRFETVTVTRVGESSPAFTFSGNVGVDNLSTLFTPQLSSATGLVIEWTNPWWTAVDNIDANLVSTVPEPGSHALMLLGGLALWLLRRQHQAFHPGAST